VQAPQAATLRLAVHRPDPDRTVTSSHRWTECGQWVAQEEVVSRLGDVATCDACALVAGARGASEGAARIDTARLPRRRTATRPPVEDNEDA